MISHALYRACVHLLVPVAEQYLLANDATRGSGATKALAHEELCRTYVSLWTGVPEDAIRREQEDLYQAVHTSTQILTDRLDEVIGYPLDRPVDVEPLLIPFFHVFHMLAIKALVNPKPAEGSKVYALKGPLTGGIYWVGFALDAQQASDLRNQELGYQDRADSFVALEVPQELYEWLVVADWSDAVVVERAEKAAQQATSNGSRT